MQPPDSPAPASASGAIRIAGIASAIALLAYQCGAVFFRYIINDDYQTLYTCWLKASGKMPGRDFFLASYYLLIDLFAPLFRLHAGPWFPLYAARFFFVVMMAIIALLLHRLATPLFSPVTGWLAPFIALGSAAMIYRGLDLRPDLITTATWLGVFVALQKEPSNRRDTLIGVLLGIGILNRFKAVLIVPLVLGAYLMRARRTSVVRALLFVAAGGVAVFALYLIWIACTDDLGTFFDVNRKLFAEMGDFEKLGEGIRGATVRMTLRVDALYWLLTLAGVGLRAMRRRDYSAYENYLCASLLVLGVLTVVLNPIYYVYNLVTLQALLAPFAAYTLARVVALVRPAVGVAIALTPLIFQLSSLVHALEPTNQHQRDLETFVLRYTKPNAVVFAFEGVGLYRPSTFHWRIPWIYIERYVQGGWRFADEFRRTPPEVVVLSYRVPGWLTPADRAFVGERYVGLTPQLMVPGFDSRGREGTFTAELLAGGEYEVLRQGNGVCTLDGQLFTSGQRFTLEAGAHRVSASRARCAFRRFYPIEARQLVANPDGLPYLSAPYLGPVFKP
jgi:hypothetical protein